MKWFANLKTAIKLIAAFIIVSMILVFVGVYGLNNLTKVNQSLKDMYNQRLLPLHTISDVEVLYQRLRINIRDIESAKDKSEKDNYLEIVKQIRADIDKDISTYSNRSFTKEHNDIFSKFAPAYQEYTKFFDQGVQLSYDGKHDEFMALLTGDMRHAGDKLTEVVSELLEYNVKQSEMAYQDGEALNKSARVITITIIIFAVVISIGFGYFISLFIARPLNRVVGLVAKVAHGDLRETTDIDTKDEVGQLAKSINNMVINLRTTVTGILSSAENVSASAQQISASTEEIASGSTSQATAAQTMSELFKDLSAAINSVASSAEQASVLSRRTMNIAQDGGKVVRSSIDGMNAVNQQMSRLEQDSNKIGEIIEVIDEIADQTNLLALNAAIEAARAGDQGRGFAVVADEVRKLAERSSEATKQITNIIKAMQENTKQSVSAVADGVLSSQKTGEAFDHIIKVVAESADMVTEIASASEEQAAQSSEVMASIESISAVTQETAAASEETAATSQTLADMAEQLNGAVSIFKIR